MSVLASWMPIVQCDQEASQFRHPWNPFRHRGPSTDEPSANLNCRIIDSIQIVYKLLGTPCAWLQSPVKHCLFFRKRRYAGVVFTRFCDLWFSVFFLKMLVVLKNVSSKNVDL